MQPIQVEPVLRVQHTPTFKDGLLVAYANGRGEQWEENLKSAVGEDEYNLVRSEVDDDLIEDAKNVWRYRQEVRNERNRILFGNKG